MRDKRTPAEMFGEFLREAAVLVAVFLPLEWLIRPPQSLPFWEVFGKISFYAFLMLGLLALGIAVEVRRR